jgi:xanthine dehydrogenase accessory factor
MWIVAEPGSDALAEQGTDVLADLDRAASGAGPPMAVVTRLVREGRSVAFGGRMFVKADGATVGSFGDTNIDARATDAALQQLPHGTVRVVPLDDTSDLMIDAVASRPRLVVAGGGHVALAIARQAQLLDFDVTILEDRPEFADPSRFAGAAVIQGDVPRTLGTLTYNWNTFIVVATRGHKLDADCVAAAVATPVRYIGLLGSRRKTILIANMLRESGVTESRIECVRSPVGLDLGGRSPAEIALSVLAEITKERYQATGGPLTNL